MRRICALSLLSLAVLLAFTLTGRPHMRRAHSHPCKTAIHTVELPACARNGSTPSADARAPQDVDAPSLPTEEDRSIRTLGWFVCPSDQTGRVELVGPGSGEDRESVTLDPASSRLFDGVELGGDECYGVRLECTPRLWVRARVRFDRDDGEAPSVGTLVELFSVDPISREWMQAYQVCMEKVDALGCLAEELPSSTKSVRFIEQSHLAVKAFQDLRSVTDGPPLPEHLSRLAKAREWTHGEEVALRDRVYTLSESIGLEGQSDWWDDGAREWSDPPLDPQPAEALEAPSKEDRARQGFARLGMEVEDLRADERRAFVLSEGIVVRRIASLSPAERAGVLPGDVLWHVTWDCEGCSIVSCRNVSSLYESARFFSTAAATGRRRESYLYLFRGDALMRVPLEQP